MCLVRRITGFKTESNDGLLVWLMHLGVYMLAEIRFHHHAC